jgi:hypothetical protein
LLSTAARMTVGSVLLIVMMIIIIIIDAAMLSDRNVIQESEKKLK